MGLDERASLPLVIENLSFKYRGRREYALRNVSFQLSHGEIILVAGASGCGKTTLIRCINGLIPRSYKGQLEGKVYLYGRDVSELSMPQISQTVGTVLQDPERQIVGSSVMSEVAFGLENLGLPREEIIARINDTLRYLGIYHLKERQTFYLSGGEKQKVAIAGTLAMRPSVLLLDEPLANLDPLSAQETLRIIRRLADEGKTVLIVEHRVEDVLKVRPDKALFLVDGRQLYFGDIGGFINAVDYREVKLPAPLIIEQARSLPAPSFPKPILGSLQESRKPLVKFEDVSFAYEDGPTVLHNVNLEIRRGDVVAILGPNGAGKTTLVKHAIGLLKPRRGRVLVEGVDTRQLSVAQIARTLGYVFQSPSHMLFAPTVREELAFGPKNLGYDQEEIEDGVGMAVKIVNLAGLEDYPPLALSFGQQKRVSIAAILAMRSCILAMDEPTAGQDYKHYMSFMDSILRLPNFSAVIFITQDIDLAICYANRVILLEGGRVIADGLPEDVLTNPSLLERCRLLPTSLLSANVERLPYTKRFMRAEELAHVKGGTRLL
jgi:energy-coupling factor transport system ATP-binding protein